MPDFRTLKGYWKSIVHVAGKWFPATSLLIVALIGACWMRTGYLRSDFLFLTGFAVMIASAHLRAPGRYSLRFGWWAVFFALAAFWVSTRSFHFLFLVFFSLFIFETRWGKLNEAPALCAFILTSVFSTLSVLFGFELRLALSEAAAGALSFIGFDASAKGNIIYFDGRPFSVDPECMGLQMVEISLLFYLFLLGHFERRFQRRPVFALWASGLAIVFLLIILYNFLRIILLVLFDIRPENPLHDIAGLVGLVFYVFAPVYFGLKRVFTIGSRSLEPAQNTLRKIGLSVRLWQAGLLSIGVYFAFEASRLQVEQAAKLEAVIPSGIPSDCIKDTLSDGIIRYRNKEILIYAKPIRGFYSAEHTPLICWRGSGFKFQSAWKEKVGEKEVHAGILEQEGALLYTAWWYDNGIQKESSQLRRRMLDALGSPGFSLVNITATNLEVLKEHLTRMHP